MDKATLVKTIVELETVASPATSSEIKSNTTDCVERVRSTVSACVRASVAGLSQEGDT
jgi:hypothetical protein